MIVDGLVQPLYNRLIRDRLPRKFGVYAGVPARGCRLLDATDQFPEYKPGLLDAIHEQVNEGDHVELVGFGRGVSSVHILEAGAGMITAHEASQEMIDIGMETLTVNEVSGEKVNVRHTLVGEGIEIYGDGNDATPISPQELSDADVLILDCEGAEETILENLGTHPETVIVETHPERGVPTEVSTRTLRPDYELEVRDYHPHRDQKDVVLAESH